MKICSKCNKLLELFEFAKRKYSNGKPYLSSVCKDCLRISAREYAKSHREERKAYQKQYTINNPSYKKLYILNNRDKIRKKERERRATDVNFKLRKNVSRAINRAITKNSNSILKYLPYSILELKAHLENQFDNNMTWENYGSYWHIDHIIPQSIFKYNSMEDEAFRNCWALNNLRPLEAKQNMMDGATRIRHK